MYFTVRGGVEGGGRQGRAGQRTSAALVRRCFLSLSGASDLGGGEAAACGSSLDEDDIAQRRCATHPSCFCGKSAKFENAPDFRRRIEASSYLAPSVIMVEQLEGPYLRSENTFHSRNTTSRFQGCA